MKVKRLHSDARIPERAHVGDLGFDLFAYTGDDTLNYCIQPGQRVLVDTGIACGFPPGFGGILKDRSGNAFKKGMHVLAGVIDEGYTGEIKVLIQNLSDQPVEINNGDKIAQMILIPVVTTILHEVDSLEDTERADKGFGSTGN